MRAEGSSRPFDMTAAAERLRDVGKLWAEGERGTQRDLVVQLFDRIVLDGVQIAELRPKPEYLPLFLIDRQERFGGDVCSLAPRAGLEPTTWRLTAARSTN